MSNELVINFAIDPEFDTEGIMLRIYQHHCIDDDLQEACEINQEFVNSITNEFTLQ